MLKNKFGSEARVFDVFRIARDGGILTQPLDEKFNTKRCYEISDQAGILRCWHGHKKESKLIYVSKGLVKFVITPITEGNYLSLDFKQEFVLSSDKPQVLYIPKGYYHGFKSLSDSKIIIFSDKTLEESKEDDFRTTGFLSWFEVEIR